MSAAAALLLALSGVAGALGGTGEIGEGAGRLTPAALRVARAKWGDDLCLAAIEVDANIEYHCRLKGERPGAINDFTFRVFNPHRPFDLCYARYREAVTSPPECVISQAPPPLDEWETSAGGGESYDFACLSGMKVESGAAIAVAVRAGLASGQRYKALLAEAAGPESGFWKFKALRRKTFWQVRVMPSFGALQAPDDTYVVDAMTGKLLMRRKGFITFPRKAFPEPD